MSNPIFIKPPPNHLMRSLTFPTSLVSPPRTRFQMSRFSQSTWRSPFCQLRHLLTRYPSTVSLPLGSLFVEGTLLQLPVESGTDENPSQRLTMVLERTRTKLDPLPREPQKILEFGILVPARQCQHSPVAHRSLSRAWDSKVTDDSEPWRPPAPCLPPTTTMRTSPPYRTHDLLGQGGYGIVCRAFDTRSLISISYTMKCLPHAHTPQSSHRCELHLHEICLHKLASAHPNGISLHREDGDLFTQILRQHRYLGQDELAERVFLQLLDVVEYSHSLSIYHRDLKPENIMGPEYKPVEVVEPISAFTSLTRRLC